MSNKDWLKWQKEVLYEEYIEPELEKRSLIEKKQKKVDHSLEVETKYKTVSQK
ncbi:hypothetical protein ACERII_04575 [Evansella sp. AB-rgal1]|uniref:hypothetical protein n=1 Tax=Evansella sp. AB-rgal1 TaxID=3242696 RepID=UPI00359E6D2D